MFSIKKVLEFEFFCHFSIEVTRFDGFFFLPCFFSFCQSNTKLDEISFAVDLHRNDRCSHFFYFGLKTKYFWFFHKDLTFTLGFYESSASLVLSDMYTSSIGVSLVYEYVGSLEIDTSISDTFYLFTEELESRLILFDDLIVEEGFFIISEDDFRGGFGRHVEIIDKCMKKQLAFHIKCDKIL